MRAFTQVRVVLTSSETVGSEICWRFSVKSRKEEGDDHTLMSDSEAREGNINR